MTLAEKYFDGAEGAAVMMPGLLPVSAATRCDFSCVDSFPLSMAYVPMQKFENIYNLEKAYDTGTLFKGLDLPFLGYMRRGGGIQ